MAFRRLLYNVAFLIEVKFSTLIARLSIILEQILVYLQDSDVPLVVLEVECMHLLGQL